MNLQVMPGGWWEAFSGMAEQPIRLARHALLLAQCDEGWLCRAGELTMSILPLAEAVPASRRPGLMVGAWQTCLQSCTIIAAHTTAGTPCRQSMGGSHNRCILQCCKATRNDCCPDCGPIWPGCWLLHCWYLQCSPLCAWQLARGHHAAVCCAWPRAANVQRGPPCRLKQHSEVTVACRITLCL